MKEFESNGCKSSSLVFNELCFCILTANFNAERAIVIQKEIGNGFLTLPGNQLAGRLKKMGYRFPNTRAKYIVEARRHVKNLKKILSSLKGVELRGWFVKNVKGLGLKEASHFLRNIGFKDYAIIDFHIVDLLVKYGLAEKPESMSKKSYLAIEKTLRKIARKLEMTLAELDLYLWFMETGKVLK